MLERPRSSGSNRTTTARALLSVAFAPSIASAAIVTAMVLVTLVAAGSDLTHVGASVAATWLAAHQVPVTIGGSTLSVLPLLATGLLVWATSRATTAAAEAGEDPRWVLSAALAGPAVVAALALIMIAQVGGGLPLVGPPVAPTVITVLVVHLLGSVIGLARHEDVREQVRRRLPGWLWSGAVLVPRVLRSLLVGAALVTAFCLVCSVPTATDLLGRGGGVTGGLGLFVLSIAYLPNIVVGALSVAVGPGAVIGATTVTAFGAVQAPLPALPLLAVVPQGSGSWWWLVVLLVPVAAALRLGKRAEQLYDSRKDALRSVGTAAVLTGLVVAVLGALAGGTLGNGAFSPVGVPALALGGVSVVWLAVVGAARVLTVGWRRGERRGMSAGV